MRCINQIDAARKCIAAGDIIAYPTEAIYGLGCDFANKSAVERLLQLKMRPIEKGLIVIISQWEQLFPLIGTIPDELMTRVKNTWPGPVTWVFPKSKHVPYWVSGEHDTVAIRMTKHPISRELCAHMPLISTSANLSGHAPAKDFSGVLAQFSKGVDVFFDGALGHEIKPSAIFDVMSGSKLR